MYIKNAPTLYELRHSKYSCKKNKFNKSKLSLIGTVQPFATNVASCGWKIVSFQSLIGTVQPQKELVNKQKELVQSLIGTVQHYAYFYRIVLGCNCVSITHRYGSTFDSYLTTYCHIFGFNLL